MWSLNDGGASLEGIGDVQEFKWEAGEGTSNSIEMYHNLYAVVRLGNQAFLDNRLEQAVDIYTAANNIKPGDSIILANRSATHLRISHFLKHRSPSASEYRPLTGMDPTTHAGLALKDAEYVMSLQSNFVTSYILKANALILLEKYELARDVIRAGLLIDPFSTPLINLDNSTCYVEHQRTDDYDCTLCLKLLYEPITTSCGHTFCRSCLFQTMDRGNKCPLCRTVLFITPSSCSVSVMLNNIIQKNFPEEYEERKSDYNSLINLGVDILPFFIMDVVLPCQKFQLRVYEPRYRLMVRRIMEGNHRMGMGVIDLHTGTIAENACEVEIVDCEALAGGHLFIEVESRRRCQIIRKWNQDGYRVAEVEWVHDIPQCGGTPWDLLEMSRISSVFAIKWIRDAQEAAQGDGTKLAKLFKEEGMMPPITDPELFSFWLVSLVDRRPSERLEFLRLRSTIERLIQGLLYLKAENRRCQHQKRRKTEERVVLTL